MGVLASRQPPSGGSPWIIIAMFLKSLPETSHEAVRKSTFMIVLQLMFPAVNNGSMHALHV